MKLVGREIVLVWLVCVVVLCVGTYLTCRKMGYISSLRDIAAQIQAVDAKIRSADELLSRQKNWEERLAELREKIRPLPEGEIAATHFKRKIDGLATRHKVVIRERRAGKEKAHAGLHVLPITCRWEETNDRGIRDLLVELKEEGAVFDTTALLIQSLGQNRLKGSFTVNCKYTKPGGN